MVATDAIAKTDGQRPIDDLHSPIADLGIFNNSEEVVKFTLKIVEEDDVEVFSKHLTLSGKADQSNREFPTNYIGSVTADSEGYKQLVVKSGGNTVSEEIYLDENGIPDYTSVGVYTHYDGELDIMISEV